MFSKTSYELTSSATISVLPGVLTSVLVITDGTNPATVIGYDKISSDGIGAANKLFEFLVAGATGYGGRNWTYPVEFATGLYVTISGTGASCIVEYMA